MKLFRCKWEMDKITPIPNENEQDHKTRQRYLSILHEQRVRTAQIGTRHIKRLYEFTWRREVCMRFQRSPLRTEENEQDQKLG